MTRRSTNIADGRSGNGVPPKGLAVRLGERRLRLQAEGAGPLGPPEGPLLIELDRRSDGDADCLDSLVEQGPVSTAACLHLAATVPNFKIQEHFNDFAEEWVKEVAPGNPDVVDGYFALPDGPGLGVTLNEDLVREHPRAEVHFDLFAEDWHFRGQHVRGR